MNDSNLLREAERLYREGFAILWLRPNSKAPVEDAWTSGPRKNWNYLKETHRPGYNVGVRLGTPSALKTGFLAVIDLDVKSTDPRHLKEALAVARKVLGDLKAAPMVKSGRGNGSRHYYAATRRPFKGYDAAHSEEIVKALMPSAKPSKKELTTLTPEEIKKGLRLRRAWEVSVMSEGRQVVLPPSVHPDSGASYEWARVFPPTALPLFAPSDTTRPVPSAPSAVGSDNTGLTDFTAVDVDVEWLDISDKVRAGVLTGEGVTDRSAFLMKASSALFSAGLNRNEVLSVLTDRKTFLGEVGYDHAATGSRARAAAWVHRYTVKRISEEKGSIEVFAKPAAPARKLSKEEREDQDKDLDGERTWKQDLLRNKQGAVSAHLLQNTVLVLENALPPATLKRDTFAIRDAYTVDTPWGGKKGEHVSDDDVPRIKYWMGREFGFEPSSNAVSDALIVVATRNCFDPIKDFLDGLPAWDEKPRLDSWLKTYFGAKGDADYLGQVFRKWMVALVMRGYVPGAKFDWMPIFEGKQNMGKSSFGKILVGDKYFLDQLPPLSDKDAALALLGTWTTEFGELSQFRKNELETIKAFTTRTVDKVRPPYGRRTIEHARRCVFFGTTNRDTYLIDETGNRRFKPVMVGRLDFGRLRADRIQLFAEARHLWDTEKETEFTLGNLTGKAAEYEAKIHHEKMVEDDSHAMYAQFMDFKEKVRKEEVEFDLEKFRIIDLFAGVGCLGNWRSDNRNYQFCAKMLKRTGCAWRMIRGQKYWKVPQVGGFTTTPTPSKKEPFTDDNDFFEGVG